MGALFDTHARLFDGLTYDRDVYDHRPGCDPELICHGLEPVTEIERRGMQGLSDIDVEILTHKLSSIVEEARDVYMSLSISEGIITGDMNCGLFTASGDPASIGTGIYFHTLLNNAQLKYILAYYRDDPSVGLADGDVFFFNEELAGGVHNLDMFTAMPIFWEGELVAWAEVGGHQGDTGSITPGGFAPTAKSRYEEGFHMPAVRIGRDFRIRQDILDYMAGAVRNPLVFTADLKSRVATLFQIRRRFLREIEKRGVGQFKINFDAKQVKDDIPDHTFVYQVPLDDIGSINWINRPDGPPETLGRFRPSTADGLLMRDSFVNLFFLNSQYLGWRGFNIESGFLWARNSQAEIALADGSGLLQPKDVRSRFSLINKVDYTWIRGSFSVTPKLKHRSHFEQIDSEGTPRDSYSDFIPIVMGQY